jgi:hypothetical protein
MIGNAKRSWTALAGWIFAALVLLTIVPAGAAVNQPLEIINRPRTLPGGELELNGGLDLFRSPGQTASSAPLGIAYGITNELEVRVFYSLGLNPTLTGRTPLDVRLSYTFYRDDRLSAAGQVRTGVDLGSNNATPLRLGLNALYKVTDTFAVFTPGEQLGVGLAGSGSRPVWIDLPVGAGLQFTPHVFGSLTTKVAHLGLANDNTAVIGRDMLRTDLAAFYSFSNRLDVGAHFDVDLKNTDYFTIGALLRIFM